MYKLTFNAFMSLWNSFSQYLGKDVNMALSVTVAPYLWSSQSEIGSLADFNISHFDVLIFSGSFS